MGEIVEMDGKGRIVIPKGIREKLDLSEGKKLSVETDGNRIVLKAIDLPVSDNPLTSDKRDNNGTALREFLVE